MKGLKGDLLGKDRLHIIVTIQDPEDREGRFSFTNIDWSCIEMSGLSLIHPADVECHWRQLTCDREVHGGMEDNMFPVGSSVDRDVAFYVFNSDERSHTTKSLGLGWSV
jgi:hypothetical protein